MNEDQKKLKKMNEWLLEKKIDPGVFVKPLDKLLLKFSLISRPSIYLKSWQFLVMHGASWFVFFHGGGFLLYKIGVISDPLTRNIYVLISSCFIYSGLLLYLQRKNAKRLHLPEWSSFCDEKT